MAEEHAPSIIFIDEIDAVGTKRWGAMLICDVYLNSRHLFQSFPSVQFGNLSLVNPQFPHSHPGFSYTLCMDSGTSPIYKQ